VRRQERTDVVAIELWRIMLIKNSKSDAVESGESLFCSNPNIAVASLGYGMDGVLWQSVLGLPDNAPVLSNLSLRIKRDHLITPENDGQAAKDEKVKS
jgi:hypothetical protein